MNEAAPEARRSLLAGGRFWLVALLAVVGLGAVAWFVAPDIYRRMMKTWLGIDDHAVRLEVTGKVMGPDGQPVVDARVHGEWEVFATATGEPHGEGSFNARTGEDGTYRQIAAFSTDVLERAGQVEVRLTLRAHGPFEDRTPSEPLSAVVAGRTLVERDFRLGAELPTVPVHVVDSAGAPVEQFWVQAIPAAGTTHRDVETWPRRWKDFPGGVAPLTIPDRPFRLKVHLYGGKRETIVGPFDPAALPERIDVTLADG